MQRLFLITVSALLLATTAAAQDPEQSWESLRTLRVGERIQVVDQRLRSQNGTFLSVSDEAMTFQVGQNEVTLQRADVLRVTSREQSKRARNALIGLGVGAGLGAAIGFGVLAATGGSDFPGEILGPAVGFGAAGGAALGAAVPSYQTIYRAERRQTSRVP